jgi:hypothetical protein
MTGTVWEYSGYVEGINIKGTQGSGDQFLFSVITQDGARHESFRSDDRQPQRYAAMASLLAAAFAAGHVIYLNTAPPPDNGPHCAGATIGRSTGMVTSLRGGRPARLIRSRRLVSCGSERGSMARAVDEWKHFSA